MRPDREFQALMMQRDPFFLRPPGSPKSDLFIKLLPWHRRLRYRLRRRALDGSERWFIAVEIMRRQQLRVCPHCGQRVARKWHRRKGCK